MSNLLPVVAAVPNYNMADSLERLLPTLLEQEYDEVVVLDDASTDESVEVVHSFGKDVQLIEGEQNVGAGGNRNRILQVVDDAMVHFIDADMSLNAERTPEVINDLTQGRQFGYIGGLVRDPDGTQIPYNFGPRSSVKTMPGSCLQAVVDRLGDLNPKAARNLRSIAQTLLKDFPDTLAEPVARNVFWSTEANLVIPSVIFAALNGYDPALRYHEALDFATRMEKLGLPRFFEPTIDATHNQVDALNRKFELTSIKAMGYIIAKHGIREYFFPGNSSSD